MGACDQASVKPLALYRHVGRSKRKFFRQSLCHQQVVKRVLLENGEPIENMFPAQR